MAPPPVIVAGPLLRMQSLRFRWRGAQADTLDLERLEVGAGERLFVRGPSGCGKSTLLALMAGVLVADSGEVSLLGHDLAALSAPARDRLRADHVGLVFQQFNLLPYLSALDNVRLPGRFSARRATARGEAERWLAALGLAADTWRRRADALSVGQQQRVAAARALVGAPALVIADEPTSALDEDSREAFMALLLQACTKAGSALVFVSHDARLAAGFDRTIDLATLNRAGRA